MSAEFEQTDRAALRAALAALPKPDYGSIVVDDSGGIRARITRNGGELACARGFRLSRYNNSIEQTHKAACEWLDNIAATLPKLTRLNRRTTKHKNSELPAGVSGGRHTDPRTGIDFLSIMVLWRDNGRRRSKTFRVGRPEWIDAHIYNAIAAVACEFRAAYVAARDKGEPFDAKRWRHWRELLPEDIQEDLARFYRLGKRGNR